MFTADQIEARLQRAKSETMRELSPNLYEPFPRGGTDCFYPVAVLLHRVLEEYLTGRAWENDGAMSAPYSHRTHGKLPQKNVAEVVHDLLQAKKEDGRSTRYIETMRSHLTRFGNAFELDIVSITAPQIEQWLRGQEDRTACSKQHSRIDCDSLSLRTETWLFAKR